MMHRADVLWDREVGQRKSEYKRIEHDAYQTPGWVVDVLVPDLDYRIGGGARIWEPAAGEGKMVRALRSWGWKVSESDIKRGRDFLVPRKAIQTPSAIVTNPPYKHARAFIERALAYTEPEQGIVAMLLKTDFDEGMRRADLFGECQAFVKKIVITERIRWIEGSVGQPSENHAWYIWDWKNSGDHVVEYWYPKKEKS